MPEDAARRIPLLALGWLACALVWVLISIGLILPVLSRVGPECMRPCAAMIGCGNKDFCGEWVAAIIIVPTFIPPLAYSLLRKRKKSDSR